MDAQTQINLFKKHLPRQVMLREIGRMLGSVEGKVCLDAGFDSVVPSLHFRRLGGTWHTLVRKSDDVGAAIEAVKDNVSVYDGARFPYEDKTFDVVIVSNFLEYVSDDNAVITECHRVLKPTGRLIVNVPHAKKWSVLHPLERVLGVARAAGQMIRPGFSEADLFQLLKHGFDVHAAGSYTKTLVKLTDIIAQFKERKLRETGADDAHLIRLYSTLYPFYWTAFQLDGLLFFIKGYHLVAMAVRHPWRPRNAPILNDGRSISEAVLSRIKK